MQVGATLAVTLHIDTGILTATGALASFSGFTIYNFSASTSTVTVYGSTGNDSIATGSGNDTFYASTGVDTLDGGGGLNVLNFINATSQSVINLTSNTVTGLCNRYAC